MEKLPESTRSPANQSTPEVTRAFLAWNDDDSSKGYCDRERGFHAGYAAALSATPARGGDELREATFAGYRLQGPDGEDYFNDTATQLSDNDRRNGWVETPLYALASTDMAGAGEVEAEVRRILAMSDEEVLAEATTDDVAWARGFKQGMKDGNKVADAKAGDTCAACGFPWGADPVRHAEFCHNRTLAAPPVEGLTSGEGLRIAVADVLNAAWSLCDDTAEGDSDQPEVPRRAWKRLSDALDALEPLIPQSEQPCWPGVAARLLARYDPAVSGLQPVPGHAEGCGAHDDYDCDCFASPKATATASVREGVKWRERWYGSEPQRGSAIVDDRGNLVAYLGGNEATHAITTAIVAAHNASLTDSGTAATIGGERA